jgi:alkylation response protein AidB-like acyl-CoA dehydrogenase
MLGFTLSEEQLALQKLAKEFAAKEIKPVSLKFETDEEGKLSENIFKKAAEVGILGLPVPI